ncbi:hypothetical protein BCR42DRAFT_403988 [Absidia repens]|uniref:F-box domain-containing protein n=1 Tax=Absidia repens TaxID=90262 RepID=A0A1X2IVR3_9FUNG|nr:hypothetical protein BCR42DRAFT_403988 [Absidia repens]
MMSLLPNEILLEIFSHMSLQQVYKMGTVCRSWQRQRDLAIYTVIRRQAKLHICASPKLKKGSMIDLALSSFNESTGMLEFKPVSPVSSAFSATSDNDHFNADIQGLRMVYSGWSHDVQPAYQKSLSPVERAQYAFHHEYNPIHQKLYLLPHYDSDNQQQRFWCGDLSVGALILLEKFAPFESVRIVLARVSIPWLLSGYPGRGPTFTKTHILKQRLKLNILGPDAGYVISNALTGTILKNDEDHGTVTRHSGTTAIGRWQHLNQELILRHIDPLVIWKYHIVQLFILGKSTLPLDEIITKIYIGEKEWEKMKPRLAKALLDKEQPSSSIRVSLTSRLRNLFHYNQY